MVSVNRNTKPYQITLYPQGKIEFGSKDIPRHWDERSKNIIYNAMRNVALTNCWINFYLLCGIKERDPRLVKKTRFAQGLPVTLTWNQLIQYLDDIGLETIYALCNHILITVTYDRHTDEYKELKPWLNRP